MRSRVFAIVIALFVVCETAFGNEPPRIPDLLVGIIPFSRSDSTVPCDPAIDTEQRLGHYGIRTRRLDAAVNPVEALAADRQLDFVVSGSISVGGGLRVLASVFPRGTESPCPIEKSGEGTCDAVAVEVLRCITEEKSVAKTVNARLAAAVRKLEATPDDFASLMTVGFARRLEGRWSEALPLFERAVQAKPKDPEAHVNLAMCGKETGDKRLWHEHLELANEINDKDPAVLIGLGNFYAEEGREEALGFYQKAAALGHRSDIANWNVACFQVSQGRLPEAIAALERIPHESPFFPEAVGWLQKLRDSQASIKARDDAEHAPRLSLWRVIGLPDGFGTPLLVAMLALALAPFLGAFELGPLKASALSKNVARVLRVVGPIAFVFSVSLWIPFIKPPVPGVIPWEAKSRADAEVGLGAASYLKPQVTRR